MADKRDFYEILELSKGASEDEIKRSYRKLAKKYHPDLNPNNKVAEKSFKEISEAYEILSDKQKKQRYDQFGHAGVDPSYGASRGAGGFGGFAGAGFQDLGDVFESFFGTSFGGSAQRANANGMRRGTDVHLSIKMTFLEACNGLVQSVNFTKQDLCDICHGNGNEPGHSAATCPDCQGKGQVHTIQRTPIGHVQTSRVCSRCSGTGHIIEHPCKRCSGSGQKRIQKTLEVSIPAGIDNGQTMTVREQGNAGVNGGPSGDLHITVTVQPDALFKRDGFDIHCEIPITYYQAVVGDEVVVPTIDGKVKYQIPAGTQPGTLFRLRSKGVTHLNGRGKGDHFITVLVEVPKHLNVQQQEVLKQFEEALNEKNYEKRKSFFHKLKNGFNRRDPSS